MIYNPLPEGTYRITQGFGERPKYYKKYGHKGHNGWDYAPLVPNTKGIPVYAPHEGFVRLRDEGKLGYGKYAEIVSMPYNTEGHRKKSDLAHLAEFRVKDGQYVGSGDLIGIMGTTGDSSGIHLHWTFKKTDSDGFTMDKNNGFNGALRIAPFTLRWVNLKLGE
jgi:murein DD-endopeptidase MepM/ murein hydrolase activator NlpD